MGLLPGLLAALWTGREVLLGAWPYGGLPWARLGITQADSPLVQTVSWVGVSGLTFLMVFTVAAAIEAIRCAVNPSISARMRRAGLLFPGRLFPGRLFPGRLFPARVFPAHALLVEQPEGRLGQFAAEGALNHRQQ